MHIIRLVCVSTTHPTIAGRQRTSLDNSIDVLQDDFGLLRLVVFDRHSNILPRETADRSVLQMHIHSLLLDIATKRILR